MCFKDFLSRTLVVSVLTVLHTNFALVNIDYQKFKYFAFLGSMYSLYNMLPCEPCFIQILLCYCSSIDLANKFYFSILLRENVNFFTYRPYTSVHRAVWVMVLAHVKPATDGQTDRRTDRQDHPSRPSGLKPACGIRPAASCLRQVSPTVRQHQTITF